MIGFLFGRLFFLDMLLIGFLLTAKFPRREGFFWRAPAAVVGCLLASVAWTALFKTESGTVIPLRMLLATFNYLGAFFLVLGALAFCTQIEGWTYAYLGAMMWFTQQAANSLDFMFQFGFGNSWKGFATHLCIILLVSAGVYWGVSWQLDVQVLRRMPLNKVAGIWFLMCLGCLELNAYASDSNQTSTAYYLAVLLLDLLGLLYQKSLYQFAGLERENESIQMLLAQGDKQYRTARENMEQVNIKCHDLRHQIRHFRQEGRIDEHALNDMEQVIQAYDTTVRTGNPALDVILTEKSLSCRSKGIGFTCMAEGSGLAYMEPADLYALFGNALENAIEATEQLEDPAQKQIAITVRPVNGFYSILIQNYTRVPLKLEHGLLRRAQHAAAGGKIRRRAFLPAGRGNREPVSAAALPQRGKMTRYELRRTPYAGVVDSCIFFVITKA